jgi:hypothetical protein
MKKVLFAAAAVSLLAACSSPVLRWIDTPAEGAGGRVNGQNWDKEITAFDFPDITGENVIIGGEPQPDGKYPIVAVVPRNSAVSLLAEVPAITYKGSSISPGLSTPENFSNPLNPVTYTVTAQDRSTREYVVKVVIREDDDGKQITGFFFTDPLTEGVIDEANHTIAITVPWGTNLEAQRPEVFYTGVSINPAPGHPVDFSAASVSPLPGQPVTLSDRAGKTPVRYIVRDQGGLTQSYDVWVFPVAAPVPPVISIPNSSGGNVDVGTVTDKDGNYKTTVIVEFPTYIENPVININYPGAGNTVNIGSIDTTINADATINLENNSVSIDNFNVVNFIPILMDNGEYMYVLVVNPPGPAAPAPAADAASIDAFYFTDPVAVGEINQDTGAISVTVPYGTDLRRLAPVICYTGKEIVGIPGANPLKDGVRSFTDPVQYTVKAGNNSEKPYTVTVTAAPNTAKDISAFAFTELDPGDTNTIIGAAPNADGYYPIQITVPEGQVISSLTPVVTHTGASITGAGFASAGGPGIQTAGTAVTTFGPTTPVLYTVSDWVTPAAGTKTYAVTVRNAGSDDDDIEITGFYFTNPLAVGAINQDVNTITVQVPSRTNTANLVPAVYFRGMSVRPGSGAANDFSGPVVYTVTGRNGKTRPYMVTVNNTASSTKDITRFDFSGIGDTETVIGAVPGGDGKYPISVWVLPGTDLTALSPDIAHTGVDIDFPAGIARDFSGPVDYTVTAEDGSEKTYAVTVNTRSGDTMLITSLIFNDIPLAGGRTLRVVAAIDQDTHTITATVPYTADISGLKPVITYIGRSIAGPTGGDRTANPFTGAARNFAVPQSYTVKSQGGGAQTYTVTVLRQSSVAAHFEGEADRSIIADNRWDQNTGIITIIARSDAEGVDPPYEWYVDGVIQAVSTTDTTFTLNVGTGNFTPGRHEILLSGIKGGLHYTGRVYFTVAGDSK